ALPRLRSRECAWLSNTWEATPRHQSRPSAHAAASREILSSGYAKALERTREIRASGLRSATSRTARSSQNWKLSGLALQRIAAQVRHRTGRGARRPGVRSSGRWKAIAAREAKEAR